MSDRTVFRVWVMGCSHVGTDLRVGGRESLADPIRQSERGGDQGGPPFDWEIALHLGDLSGSQTPPDDEEGREVVRQFSAAVRHRREQFYNIAGNHDASGPGEPCQWWYHGYFPDGAPEGASYLYFVDGCPDAQAFEKYLEAHPGAIDLWLGGHTHTDPDDRTGGRSHVEEKWGVTFVNAAALTRYHVEAHAVPMSRLLTFEEGSDQVRIQCYLHTSDHAPQGWYAPAERIVHLRHPFRSRGEDS